jgi:ABC-type amino acid transport substrate-binding protein
MNDSISRIRKPGASIFWLAVLFLIITGAILVAALPTRHSQEDQWIEPEMTVLPKNTFDRTLRVVGDIDYKPFSYAHGDFVPRGYDIELVAELANRLEYNLKFQLTSWVEAVAMIKESEADLIMGCDKQDSSVMDCAFTIPTFEEKFVAFELKQSESFNDLYNKRIALIEGCGLKETMIRQHLWRNCFEYETVTDCVNAVLRGERDCFIAHATIGEVALRSFGRDAERFRGRMDIATGQMCLGIAEKNSEFLAKLDNALTEMRADGTLGRLQRKWIEPFEHDPSDAGSSRNHLILFLAALDLLVLAGICVTGYALIRNRATESENSKSDA